MAAGAALTGSQVFVGRHKIKILDKKEQEGMRKVCRMAREVLDIAARESKPGVTTDHIDKIVHEACIERDVSSQRTSPHTLRATNTNTTPSPTPPP